MKSRLMNKVLMFGALAVGCCTNVANAGYIVVNNDEWTFSDSGFNRAGVENTGSFISNIGSLFTGDQPGNFLAYTSNFGFTQSQIDSALSDAGHLWTVSTQTSIDAAALSIYDGIFLAGRDSYAAAQDELLNYLIGGGNVYIAAGTGNWGAPAEAAAWNTLLASVGLAFDSSYNGVGGNLEIDSDEPLFDGVESLYFNNGNTIIDLDLANSATNGEILFSQDGKGLLAIASIGEMPPQVSQFTPNSVTADIPEPTSMSLFAFGLLGFASRKMFKERKVK